MSRMSEAALHRRHDVVVTAVHEAIELLLAPFAENDEIPGTITEAVEVLRTGLRDAGKEPRP